MSAAGRVCSPAVVGLMAGITMIGLALRLPSFSDSMFGDEVSTYFVVAGHGPAGILDHVRGPAEGTPPLYFLFTWVTQGLGDPAQGLRVPSLVAGVAMIPFTYFLGIRTVDRRAAGVGAALVALSPLLILYSAEARAYMLMALLALLSTLALLRALESGGASWWVCYAALAAGAALTHYSAVFVLVGQFGWAFLARPDARRRLVAASLLAGVLFLPWVDGFLDDRDAPAAVLIDVLRPFGAGSALTDTGHWAFGGPGVDIRVPPSTIGSPVPLSSLPGVTALVLISCGLGLALLGAGRELKAHREVNARWRPESSVSLVLALAFASPLGAALVSSVSDSVYLPRNLIASWPAFALAVGALLGAGRGIYALAATALVLSGFALGAVKLLDPDNRRPDYNAAAEFIEKRGSDTHVVEVPMPFPGPQTSLEAAVAAAGREGAEPPVTPLGWPSLAQRRAMLAPDGPGPFAKVTRLTPAEVARGIRPFARDRGLILVRPGSEPFETVAGDPESDLDEFLAALPPGFVLDEARTFPGYGGVTVYVLRDSTSG